MWLLDSLNISSSPSEDCQAITNSCTGTYHRVRTCARVCVKRGEKDSDVLFRMMSEAVWYCADETESQIITAVRHTHALTHTYPVLPQRDRRRRIIPFVSSDSSAPPFACSSSQIFVFIWLCLYLSLLVWITSPVWGKLKYKIEELVVVVFGMLMEEMGCFLEAEESRCPPLKSHERGYIHDLNAICETYPLWGMWESTLVWATDGNPNKKHPSVLTSNVNIHSPPFIL